MPHASGLFSGIRYVWKALLPEAIRIRVPQYVPSVYRWFARHCVRPVPIDRVLCGDNHGLTAAHYSRVIGDPLWPSTPLSQSPHVMLLQRYKEIGLRVLEPEELQHTEYFGHAARIIDVFGNYFEARDREHVRDIAKRFVSWLEGHNFDTPRGSGHSDGREPIVVRPILHSDCYQTVNGHHRLAIAYVRGLREICALVNGPAVLTPLQQLLLDVLWVKGRTEMYQPIDAPEVARWTLTRRCTDRFAKIREFLTEQNLLPPHATSYLDVGCSYGWFVAQMQKLGFSAYGVERDPIALAVGHLCYRLDARRTLRGDCVRFLRDCQTVYDVVSCFSLLHHFVLGRCAVSAEQFARLLDRVTGRVLFLDTGQNHEAWFRGSLREWDAEYIECWLRRNTTFKSIWRPGADEDARPPYEANYGRMLFACVR